MNEVDQSNAGLTAINIIQKLNTGDIKIKMKLDQVIDILSSIKN
jgi:hypothetical protein